MRKQRWQILLFILLIAAVMIAVAIPGVRKVKQHDLRAMTIKQLVLIDAAKERYALDHDLRDGALVTLEQLRDHDKVLHEMPVSALQPGRFEVRPIGELPEYIYDGKSKADRYTLNPHSDPKEDRG